MPPTSEELEHKIAMEDREHENHMQQMILERQSELEVSTHFQCSH